MKKLFFALLVFNLVFWLWGKRQELVPEPVSIEPGIGIIRLLDADAVAARREAAAAQVTVPGGVVTPSAELAGALPPAASAEAPAHVEAPAQVEAPASVAVPVIVDEPTAAPAVAIADASPPVVVPDLTETLMPSPSATAPSGAIVPPPEAAAGGAAEDAPLRPVEAPAETLPPPAPVAVEPAPVVEPPPDLMPVPVARPPPAPEGAIVCESVGPFRDRAGAERYAAGVPAPLLRSGVREEVVARAARYWVVAPAARDADPVYRQALVDAGVHDAWRVKAGTLAGRLSLGSFLVEDNARKQIALLAGKGVAAELLPVKEQERRWWVDYERPQAASPARPPAGSEPAKQVVGRPCGRVAGP